MSITRKIRRALRGEVGLRAALLEACRRVGVALRRRRERAALDGQTDEGASLNARLAQAFARMSDAALLRWLRRGGVRSVERIARGEVRRRGRRIRRRGREVRRVD